MLFLDSVDEGTRIKEETSKGILKSSNDLKAAMKRDINLIVEAKTTKEKKGKKRRQGADIDV